MADMVSQQYSPLARLSGELRNKIYRELLTMNGDDYYCSPQILATSKAFNAEASSILYGDNTLRIALVMTESHVWSPRGPRESEIVQKAEICVGKHRSSLPLGNDSYDALLEGVKGWPLGLHKFKSIDVQITHSRGGNHVQETTTYYLLCFLVCYLQRATNPLELTYTGPTSAEITALWALLPSPVHLSPNTPTDTWTPRSCSRLHPTRLLPQIQQHLDLKWSIDTFISLQKTAGLNVVGARFFSWALKRSCASLSRRYEPASDACAGRVDTYLQMVCLIEKELWGERMRGVREEAIRAIKEI